MSHTRLSRRLSSLLRHNAIKEGFCISSDGYVLVEDILRSRGFNNNTEEDIRAVVQQNDKQRFTLRENAHTGKMEICANQGHSFPVKDLSLTRLLCVEDVPVAIHGTYWKSWNSIRRNGLSRMRRQHVHLAPGEPGEDGVISGMRSSCQVHVYLDTQKAINDGLELFKSPNNVILCPGNADGVILPTYFKKVIDVSNKTEVPL